MEDGQRGSNISLHDSRYNTDVHDYLNGRPHPQPQPQLQPHPQPLYNDPSIFTPTNHIDYLQQKHSVFVIPLKDQDARSSQQLLSTDGLSSNFMSPHQTYSPSVSHYVSQHSTLEPELSSSVPVSDLQYKSAETARAFYDHLSTPKSLHSLVSQAEGHTSSGSLGVACNKRSIGSRFMNQPSSHVNLSPEKEYSIKMPTLVLPNQNASSVNNIPNESPSPYTCDTGMTKRLLSRDNSHSMTTHSVPDLSPMTLNAPDNKSSTSTIHMLHSTSTSDVDKQTGSLAISNKGLPDGIPDMLPYALASTEHSRLTDICKQVSSQTPSSLSFSKLGSTKKDEKTSSGQRPNSSLSDVLGRDLKQVKGKNVELSLDEAKEKKNQQRLAMNARKRRERQRNLQNQVFKCTDCGKCFQQANHLKHHEMIHTGVKPYECEICNKRFSEPSNLRRHQLVHSDTRAYECEICGKTFRYADALKKHMPVHLSTQQYTCDCCSKTFPSEFRLKTHMVIHNKDQVFSCEICGKEFYRECYLKTHHNVHSNAKPYGCDLCGKSFRQSATLKSHKETHLTDKFYKCNDCGKEFRRRSSLSTHVCKNPEELSDNTCGVCSKYFKSEKSLNKHILTHFKEARHEDQPADNDDTDIEGNADSTDVDCKSNDSETAKDDSKASVMAVDINEDKSNDKKEKYYDSDTE